MDWVRTFYDKQDEWTGCCRGEIMASDRERAFRIARLLGGRQARVLELGCGGGQTAAAIAELGHIVVAMDSSLRAIESARRRARADFRGRMEAIHADYYTFEPGGRFDVVCCFDGFGVGEDDDQRRLLRRIARWLEQDGSALIEVYAPSYWAAAAGTTMLFGDASRRYGFDAVGGRMLDTWWPNVRPEEAVTQSLRCYGPADLCLLLKGTGLVLAGIEPGGAVDPVSGEYHSPVPLERAMSYLATVRRAQSRCMRIAPL
ncbi:MAG: class I SAM-dependent methyltransferase [Candidatus Bipolaricaulis sp.]|nr:class I SAM-dependent methyltransferase [Candidatus Bipolaricaulis sp.]